MSEDAKFEDGGAQALRLIAQDAEDLKVISSLAQDAVFPTGEMSYAPSKRNFALLLNRFRWEDASKVKQAERVQAVLVFDDVVKVATNGLHRSDPEMVLSLLSVIWMPGEDGAGRFELTLAGDGAIALDVECINVTLQDVTRPYLAPSGKAPEHPE